MVSESAPPTWACPSCGRRDQWRGRPGHFRCGNCATRTQREAREGNEARRVGAAQAEVEQRQQAAIDAAGRRAQRTPTTEVGLKTAAYEQMMKEQFGPRKDTTES
jgi:hypothetical protein